MTQTSRILAIGSLLVAATLPTAARAAPGLAEAVYGANVYKGEVEAEIRFGQLTGGRDAGEQGLTLELGFTPTSRLRIEALAEFGRDAGGSRKLESAGIEAIYHLGRVGGVDVAVYGEYSIGSGHPDKAETKLLLERNTRSFDARLNLIAEKPLASGERVELAYAASFDVPAAKNLRVGVTAFGELGTFRNFAPREEHYAGPIVKTVFDHLGGHTLKIEAGYLFALGEARENARGQARLLAELEF